MGLSSTPQLPVQKQVLCSIKYEDMMGLRKSLVIRTITQVKRWCIFHLRSTTAKNCLHHAVDHPADFDSRGGYYESPCSPSPSNFPPSQVSCTVIERRAQFWTGDGFLSMRATPRVPVSHTGTIDYPLAHRGDAPAGDLALVRTSLLVLENHTISNHLLFSSNPCQK